MCMRVKPNYFQMRLLGIFHRILKSVAFNVTMFVSGFLIASVMCICVVHKNATRNNQYQYVQNIGEKLKEFRDIEKNFNRSYGELEDLILKLKQRLAHDEQNVDNVISR